MNIEFGKISVKRIIESESKTSDVALLTCKVTTTYPAGKAGTSLGDGLYDDEVFGEGKSYTSDRYALSKVPKGESAVKVAKQIAQFPNARLYRILSLDVLDVLTDEQKSAMDDGFSGMTLEMYKESHPVKDDDGEVVLHNGDIMYKSVHFSSQGKDDIDLR